MVRLFAVILAWVFIWWLANAIVDGFNRGNPGFQDVYTYIVGAVSAGKELKK